ncbi:hypothetical protein [Xanthomonas citri]|nr:hypothetical protein [Xanthomonas citri]QRD62701.1 hypothetical protein H8Z74_22590 [Xanthomonas citri pv. citri]
MDPYLELSRRINSDYNDHVVAAPTGYVLLVARDVQGERSWECLLAGNREQVLQPSLLEDGGKDAVGVEVRRLNGWLHQLIATPVSILDVNVEKFRGVWMQLQISAELLRRVSALPMTIALRSEGAFDAELGAVSLEVDSASGLARRLGWLLEVSNPSRPVFQPVKGAATDSLGAYLARAHGRLLRRGRA